MYTLYQTISKSSPWQMRRRFYCKII